MDHVNYYDILQVDRNADIDAIKHAFNRLVKIYHPDINRTPTADQDYLQIRLAYEVLIDPKKREYYDNTLKNSKNSSINDEEKEYDISNFVTMWNDQPILNLPGDYKGFGLGKAKLIVEAYNDEAIDDFIEYCENDIEWCWSDGYDIWDTPSGPVLKLRDDFGFGKRKAELFKKHIELIKTFVAQCGK